MIIENIEEWTQKRGSCNYWGIASQGGNLETFMGRIMYAARGRNSTGPLREHNSREVGALTRAQLGKKESQKKRHKREKGQGKGTPRSRDRRKKPDDSKKELASLKRSGIQGKGNAGGKSEKVAMS